MAQGKNQPQALSTTREQHLLLPRGFQGFTVLLIPGVAENKFTRNNGSHV
jgi:hypothetical protein